MLPNGAAIYCSIETSKKYSLLQNYVKAARGSIFVYFYAVLPAFRIVVCCMIL